MQGREGHKAGMEQGWLLPSPAPQNLSHTTASSISITFGFT